ncbi:MAG: hypothetical protein ACRDQA_27415 [Nocardioidaceae bacterium]
MSWLQVNALGAASASKWGLLRKRRQALITAAVTGEFAIPGRAEKGA